MMLSRLCAGIVGMVMAMKIRTYSELSQLATFEERFHYLNLQGIVGEETFGYDRYLNQMFYNSTEWKALRHQIIVRDNGCDLGIVGREIYKYIVIHHMNPITKQDILDRSTFVMDPEYLICVSDNTHRAIHYGDESLLLTGPIERTKNDTCPWRR